MRARGEPDPAEPLAALDAGPGNRLDAGLGTALDADLAGDVAELPDSLAVATPHPHAKPEEAARIPTFAALSVVAYRRLFVTGVLVFFAVQAQQIARGQLAYELTGSNAGLGGVYLGFGLPMLFITPFGGVAADRLPKRVVLLAAQCCLVVSALWIALADTFDVLEYWMIVGAAVLQAVGFSVYGPTRVAFTGELVPKGLLPNAVVLTQMGLNATRVFAPAVAGVFIGIQAVGTHGVYLATAGLMLLALIVTSRLPHRPPPADRPKRKVQAEFLDGVQFVRSEPALRLLMITSFVMVLVGWPYLAFLPSASIDLFDAGSSGYGLMSSVSAVAALGVTFWIAGRSSPSQVWNIQSASGVLLGVGLLLFAASPSLGFALAALLLVGGAASGYQSMNNTLVLTITPMEYHGRVQSLLMLSFSGMGMAALPLGALADAVGLRPTFTGMGVICILAMAIYTLRRRRLIAGAPHLDVLANGSPTTESPAPPPGGGTP